MQVVLGVHEGIDSYGAEGCMILMGVEIHGYQLGLGCLVTYRGVGTWVICGT